MPKDQSPVVIDNLMGLSPRWMRLGRAGVKFPQITVLTRCEVRATSTPLSIGCIFLNRIHQNNCLFISYSVVGKLGNARSVGRE